MPTDTFSCAMVRWRSNLLSDRVSAETRMTDTALDMLGVRNRRSRKIGDLHWLWSTHDVGGTHYDNRLECSWNENEVV